MEESRIISISNWVGSRTLWSWNTQGIYRRGDIGEERNMFIPSQCKNTVA